MPFFQQVLTHFVAREFPLLVFGSGYFRVRQRLRVELDEFDAG